ncbi:MAG: hypothetical protein WA709_05615 [Stellaceae bacterium]
MHAGTEIAAGSGARSLSSPNRTRTAYGFLFAFNTLLGIGVRTTPAPYRVLIRKAA